MLLPLLRCLVVDEILTMLSGRGAYAQGYADDNCLLAVGKFPNTVSGLIQWDLGTIEAWCGELGLSVNPDKTWLVTFTRKRNYQVSLNLVYSEGFYNAPCRSSI